MKAVAYQFKIRAVGKPNKAGMWEVVRISDNTVVRTCKGYINARNWHAAFACNVSYAVARRMVNV